MAVVGGWLAALATCNRRDLCRRFCNTLMASLLVPPASVRGMTKLDRSKFTTVAEVPVLRLGQVNLATVMPALKKYLLKVQKFKPVQKWDESNGEKQDKIAYLDPAKVQKFEDIEEADRKLLRDNNVTEIFRKEITLGYDNWWYDQIFKAVFPEESEVPNAYSKVGHIVHLNLRDSQLPLKHFVGEVLLDKLSHARTVVNKLNTINATYRYFDMEVIAGDKDTLATVTENGCQYKFDFKDVYWNPRLSTEHQNLVSFLKAGDVLYDVFAGVGPFAIPAARKGCKVMANDLNSESCRWLRTNADNKTNKTNNNITIFNKDGREFLREDVKNDLLKRRSARAEGSEHIAMNLPAMAAEFLDVFPNWFSEEEEAKKVCEKPPMVHLYCFIKLGKDEDPHSLAKLLVNEKLGRALTPESSVTTHHVRNVSPNKEMMREKMGKNKPQHKTKNVFKVAGARSLKHKAKAQKVSTELKKLNVKSEKKSAKGKTAEVDKQLVELQKEVLQGKPAKIVKESDKKKKTKQNVNTKTRMATRAQTEAAANLVEGMQL